MLLRFGVFELDPVAQELRRGGVLVKLSPQQMRVLRLLAERGGQVCTREEIQREIWGTEVYVDFDRALNVCVAAIRSALNDDSEAARFIQTLPRQGYRFVAPVEQVGNGPAPEKPRLKVHRLAVHRRDVRIAAFVVAAVVVVTAGSLLMPGRTTRLAVLPIENVSGEAAVALGLTDEMTTQLGTAEPQRLAVVGRTSAARYAGGKAVLAELGVDYLIEGSLRTEGGQSRIAVRLVEAKKQTQVWSDTFQLAGITRLELQTDVAQRVAAAVVHQLFPKSAPAVGVSYEPNAQAAEAYWNGRYLDARDPARAIQWFTQAAGDPKFAEPRAAMAETWLGQAMSGPSAEAGDAFARAGAAARAALAIDKRNAEAHAALGTVEFWYEWKAREARKDFEEALERNPSLARAHHDYGFLLVETGEPGAGVAELRTALALDPVAPRVNLDAGWVFLQARRFDDAVRYARRALELEPRLEEAELCIARANLYQGKSGPEELEKLRASADPYYRAMGAAMTGRADEAIAALQEALARHHSMMAMAGTEPAFDRLRKDARFVTVVKKVGITP